VEASPHRESSPRYQQPLPHRREDRVSDTDDPTFYDLVDKLTRSRPEVITTDNGLTKVEADGLLHMLREAIFAGFEGTGGTSSFGSKPPLDAGAVDLLNLIDTQAAAVLRAVDPKPTPLGTTEVYVRLWAAHARPDSTYRIGVPATSVTGEVFTELQDITAIRLVAQWIAKIEAFFDPPATADIMAPCPECGIELLTRISDGVVTHPYALNLRRDRRTGDTIDAVCLNCGRTWQRPELVRLAALVGAKPLPEMENE
jgi:hypothetical protein